MDIGSADSHPKAPSEKCLSTVSSIFEVTTTLEKLIDLIRGGRDLPVEFVQRLHVVD